ncbi:MAG: hypothetical protein ABFD75_07430 [Smithella sp.]
MTKDEFIGKILKEANYEAKKAKRDAILQEIITLRQESGSYVGAAEETDKTIALLSEQIRNALLKGEDENADSLILKRLGQEAKALEFRNTAKKIKFTTIPSIEKNLPELEHEIADSIRAATEQQRSYFLQVVDEKMRDIDSLIMTWQMAVKAVEDETGTKNLFASHKFVILPDDGTRYVLLPKMKG